MTCLGWIDRGANKHSFCLRPFHRDLDMNIVIQKPNRRNEDLRMHAIVRAALSRLKGQMYKGEVLEVLPSIDDPETERQIVADIHGFPTEFSDKAIADAEHSAQLKPGHRIDLTHATIVTIDGETAKDFDDAIGVEITKEGHFLLTVSIADVSHYVREGTTLNHEALLRATSVYLPNYCYPMLPEVLSNNHCSLVPKEDRLTLTCEMLISKKGEILKRRIFPSVIHSKARLTYTVVAEVLEKRAHDLLPPKITEMLLKAQELSQLVRDERKSRGALDLDLPESQIICDDEGNVTDIRKSDRNEAHRLIEDFMILANEQVSEAIEAKEYPSIYRVHETPDPLKMDRLKQVIKHWGFALSEKKGLVPSLQGFLDSVRSHENEKTLVVALLRSLKQAQYSPTNVGHFGLGSESYCHFTSPIRRYPDLMIHRILRKSDFLKSDKAPYSYEHLEAISKVSSENERRAFLAERDLEDLKKGRFLEPYVGKSFDGVITSVKSFGFFVELLKFPIEGLVPMRTLPRDDWTLDDLETHIKGYRSKEQFWLGDRVKIQLLSVDRLRRQITFKCLAHERG